MKKELLPIPAFTSKAEERAFWQNKQNDTTKYLDWDKAKRVDFPNLKRSTQPNEKANVSR